MTILQKIADVRHFVVRHRVSIQDWLLIAAAIAVASYVLYDIDLFVNGETTPHAIEADELAVIGAILCVGMLIFSWRRSQAQKREAARRLAAEKSARELAMQDPLTGLPNRRRFMDALNAALAAPPRADGTHALLMLDLNGFKQINDVHGHAVGDGALIAVAERLMGVMRQGDLVARLGGDEFAILAEHLSGAESATGIGLRVSEALSTPIAIGSSSHLVSSGIGIALFPFDGNTPEEIMRRADIALYRAKGERDSIPRFFDEDMDRQVRERDFMERELRRAITDDRIQPHFQPLVELKTGKVVGFEALARWMHRDLGDIAPDRFIPIAEDTGLIHEMSSKLLRAACHAARSWPDDVVLAFNISPMQLKDRTLGLRVLSILGETGVPPNRLELEITESALVRDLEAAQQVLGSLRCAGVRIALDDFGTGYSSLYHLRNFRVDKIKIDRSFVQAMNSERESSEIVAALIGLGHGLGMTVTAEGIEIGSQNSELKEIGCEQGQGYLYGKAVPASETSAFFATHDAGRVAAGMVAPQPT